MFLQSDLQAVEKVHGGTFSAACSRVETESGFHVAPLQALFSGQWGGMAVLAAGGEDTAAIARLMEQRIRWKGAALIQLGDTASALCCSEMIS